MDGPLEKFNLLDFLRNQNAHEGKLGVQSFSIYLPNQYSKGLRAHIMNFLCDSIKNYAGVLMVHTAQCRGKQGHKKAPLFFARPLGPTKRSYL